MIGVKRAVSGDKEMLSWQEGDTFCALITDRMATAEEINAALAQVPGVEVGRLQGIRFVEGAKRKP